MTRLPNPDLIKKIEQITIEEISKNGVENISMRKIAILAKITPTTIYYYFKDKEDLFESIKKDGFKKFNHYVLSQINDKDSYTKQVEGIIRNFINWLIENKNLALLIFDKLPPNLLAEEEKLAYYYEVSNKVVEILKNGKKNKEFDFIDAEIEANVGFAMIFGIVKLYFNKRLSPQFWDDISVLVDRIVQIVLNSIKNKE